MEEKTRYNKTELEKLIKKGLNYIEFDTNDQISINLLFKLREYLFSQTCEWYKDKFLEAYKFDIGNTRKWNDTYYSDDGIKYYCDDGSLNKCIPHGGKEEIDIDPPIKHVPFHCYPTKSGAFYYYYINEIDHFFTHCINNWLIGKGASFGKEIGMLAIKNQIEQEQNL